YALMTSAVSLVLFVCLDTILICFFLFILCYFFFFFFFQAEDGIRDGHVTGVQTCALPICRGASSRPPAALRGGTWGGRAGAGRVRRPPRPPRSRRGAPPPSGCRRRPGWRCRRSVSKPRGNR